MAEPASSAIHVWIRVQSSLLGMIFLLALVLNTMLILVLRKMKSRRSNRDSASCNIERCYVFLLFHLAFADMLGVILNIPHDILKNSGFIFYIGCRVLPPFQLASTTAQAGTYVALSYHRFQALVHPIRASLTVYKSLIMIAIIWLISASLSLPYFIVLRFNETSKSCDEDWPKSSSTVYTFSIFAVQYAAPVISMAFFYVTIAKTLHDHRIAKEMVHVPTQDDVRSHKHIIKMLITIVIVYGVCMLPHHILWMIKDLQEMNPSVFDVVFGISYLFTYSNSVANPFVFFFYNRESRYHLKRFFKKLVCNRTTSVPFEINMSSATWSGFSKDDSQRPEERRSSNKHLKLDKLFPRKAGESEFGVSLPWEAQVMTSPTSSESYRDYPSSPPTPEKPIVPDDPPKHANDTANPYLYAELPKVSLSHGNKTIQNIVQNNERLTEGGKSVSYSDEEKETTLNTSEDVTTRLQHMIERMIQDIKHDLNQDSAMNGSTSNSGWETMMNTEGSSNSLAHAGTSAEDFVIQNLKGYNGSEKDITEFRKQLESLPETRM